MPPCPSWPGPLMPANPAYCSPEVPGSFAAQIIPPQLRHDSVVSNMEFGPLDIPTSVVPPSIPQIAGVHHDQSTTYHQPHTVDHYNTFIVEQPREASLQPEILEQPQSSRSARSSPKPTSVVHDPVLEPVSQKHEQRPPANRTRPLLPRGSFDEKLLSRMMSSRDIRSESDLWPSELRAACRLAPLDIPTAQKRRRSARSSASSRHRRSPQHRRVTELKSRSFEEAATRRQRRTVVDYCVPNW